MPWVYMLRCKGNNYYSGWTNNVEKRVRAHQSGKGAKFTKSHLPVVLVYTEELPTKSECLVREAALKKLTHEQKEILAFAWEKEHRDNSE